jgi:microcystin-dependent protein
MADPFLGEIRMFAFDYLTPGWAMCNGQVLSISQNQALFSLLGTTYGGNGQTTFGIPDLRGRVPIHFGSLHALGEVSGQEAHTLTIAELPAHTHFAQASTTDAETNVPSNSAYLGAVNNTYAPASNLVAMGPTELSFTGGSQPHPNMQPYLVVSFCIALQGIFPSR